MAMEGDDRISNLPLFLLHNIIRRAYPYRHPQRLCVLSKKWRSIFTCYPHFRFRFALDDDGDINHFIKFVDTRLDTFLADNFRILSFHLHCHFWDTDSASQHADRWIESVLCGGVSYLYLSVTTDSNDEYFPNVHYIMPKTTFIPKFSGSGYSKLLFLENLSLNDVRLSESIIQDIMRNCPNLRILSLSGISGLKTLRIFNLEKLRTIKVALDRDGRELDSVLIDAPNLKFFRFASFEEDITVKIGFVSSPRLRTIVLEQCSITDDEFSSLLSSCPNIEDMHIAHCYNLHKFVISLQRLSSLQLLECNAIEVLDIDAPKLSLFNFNTRVMPLVCSKKIACPITIFYSFTWSQRDELANSWFLKLKELLATSKQIQAFNLTVYTVQVKFNVDDFEEDAIPPTIEVDHLNLTSCGLRTPMNHSSLIDALLWSCHPKRISMKCESNFEKHWIKALCKKLLDNKPVCCSASRVKCWRHDLKTAKIAKFGSIVDEQQLLNWRSLSHALPSLSRDDQVSFNLEWDFS